MFTFYVVLQCNKKLEKLLNKLKISEQYVLGVRTGKSGPLERARLANQIQGSRIPDYCEAREKKTLIFIHQDCR